MLAQSHFLIVACPERQAIPVGKMVRDQLACPPFMVVLSLTAGRTYTKLNAALKDPTVEQHATLLQPQWVGLPISTR